MCLFHENILLRSNARSRISADPTGSEITVSIARTIASVLCGGTSIPASPITSGIDEVLEQTTGRRDFIASRIGRPNPS